MKQVTRELINKMDEKNMGEREDCIFSFKSDVPQEILEESFGVKSKDIGFEFVCFNNDHGTTMASFDLIEPGFDRKDNRELLPFKSKLLVGDWKEGTWEVCIADNLLEYLECTDECYNEAMS